MSPQLHPAAIRKKSNPAFIPTPPVAVTARPLQAA